MSKRSAKKPPAKPAFDTKLRDALAEAQRDVEVFAMQLENAQRGLIGAREAHARLAKVFFADYDGKPQEAFDSDWRGLKTAYEKLGNAASP